VGLDRTELGDPETSSERTVGVGAAAAVFEGEAKRVQGTVAPTTAGLRHSVPGGLGSLLDDLAVVPYPIMRRSPCHNHTTPRPPRLGSPDGLTTPRPSLCQNRRMEGSVTKNWATVSGLKPSGAARIGVTLEGSTALVENADSAFGPGEAG
jgi:hypothetical protein